MSRRARPTAVSTQRVIQQMIRSLPPTRVVVTRETPNYNNSLGENSSPSTSTVYAGEALVKPLTGSVNRYGIGQVQNNAFRILISGNRGVQQGDFITWESYKFQIRKDVLLFGAFTVIDIEQFSQKT